MLYKAALKDTATSGESTEEEGSAPATGTSGPPPPHPYHMALGVLSLQKVLVTYRLLFQWLSLGQSRVAQHCLPVFIISL